MTAETLEGVILDPAKYPNLFSKAEDEGVTPSTVSGIQSARYGRKGEELKDLWLWAADGCGYGVNNGVNKDGDVFFYHTNAAENPGLKDPKGFARQVTGSGAFFLEPEQSKTLEAKANNRTDNSVVASNMSRLKRQGMLKTDKDNKGIVYVEVRTDVLIQGKESFREIYGDEVTNLFDATHGEAVYGGGGIGTELNQMRKETTRIYFVNPDIIKNKLKNKQEGTTLWMAAYVGNFGNSSDVHFNSSNLSNPHRGLHGTVRKSGEARADAKPGVYLSSPGISGPTPPPATR